MEQTLVQQTELNTLSIKVLLYNASNPKAVSSPLDPRSVQRKKWLPMFSSVVSRIT